MRRRRLFLATIFGILVATCMQQTAQAMPNEVPSGQAFTYGPSPLHAGWHLVRAGETVFCIARGYGVDPWAITYANALYNPNLIQPGRWLSIPNVPSWLPPGPTCVAQFTMPSPPPPGGCTCANYHYVQWGDTVNGIATWYGADPLRIAACNGLYDPNAIQAGSTLCIPAP